MYTLHDYITITHFERWSCKQSISICRVSPVRWLYRAEAGTREIIIRTKLSSSSDNRSLIDFRYEKSSQNDAVEIYLRRIFFVSFIVIINDAFNKFK